MNEPFESLSKAEQLARIERAATGDHEAARWVLAEVPRDLLKPAWVASLEEKIAGIDARGQQSQTSDTGNRAGKGIVLGKWKGLVIALAFFIVGFTISAIASAYVTPYSVSVSGYTRSNGTRVSGYSRRPSGSRSHDAPFELVASLGSLAGLGGLIGSGICTYQLVAKKRKASRVP